MRSPFHRPAARARIALVGTAPSCRFTPVTDPALEIWCVAGALAVIARADVVVEIHDRELVEADGYVERLALFPGPVFMQAHYPDIPTSTPYPLDQVAQLFTVAGRLKPPLTSTVAFMLALALARDPAPAEITLYGLDLSTGTEYEYQREAVAFFMGVALARGIALGVQPTSDLLYVPYVYGYEEAARAHEIARLSERRKTLAATLALEQAAAAPATETIAELRGALTQVEIQLRRIFIDYPTGSPYLPPVAPPAAP